MEYEEITLNPGELSKVITRKNNHSIRIGVTEGKGKIIQLDIRNSKKKGENQEIQLDEDEIVDGIRGDRFQIIASPDNSIPLLIIVLQSAI